MRRVNGDCEYLVLNGSRPLAGRRALAVTFCELLTDPGEHAAATELKHWHRILREDQVEAYRELELAVT